MVNLSEIGAVIGYRRLGQFTAKEFNIKKYFDLEGSSTDLSVISNCRYVFITLPTVVINGSCNASEIRDYAKQLSQYPRAENIILIIRSTVLPGTSQGISGSSGLKVAYNPVFSYTDQRAIVIGVDDPLVEKPMWDLYDGTRCPVQIKTDTITAERIKFINSLYHD